MRLRSAFHFLATAILTSAVLSVVNLIWIVLTGPGSIDRPLNILVGLGLFWAVSFPFVLVGGLLFGLPVHAYLKKAGRAEWQEYLLAGPFVGAVGSAILGSLFLMSPIAVLPFAAVGAVAGFCAALTWWNLAFNDKQREDTHG